MSTIAIYQEKIPEITTTILTGSAKSLANDWQQIHK